MDFKNCIQRDLIQRVDIDVHLWEILRLFRFDALSEIKYLHGLRKLTLFLRRYEDEQEFAHENAANRLVRGRELLGGRMLFESETTDREIAQCQWYVQMVKWEVEHGDDEWREGKPSVQMWII